MTAMNVRRAAALAGVMVAAGAASGAAAQEFKGAELSVEALSFDRDDAEVFSNYRGSVEVGVMGSFGVAADLAFYEFGDGADGIRDVTLHVLSDTLPMATVGLFLAHESSDGDSVRTIGVEAGRSFGAFGLEGFAGFGDDDEAEYRLIGFDGTFDVTPKVSVLASGALLDVDGGSVGRFSVGGEYRIGQAGPALYAEIGRIGAQDDASGVDDGSGFLGIGARIALGPNRGTTFESRGIADVLGGF